jgi:uncharacterized membrane protein YbhN (UPF0104 family)
MSVRDPAAEQTPAQAADSVARPGRRLLGLARGSWRRLLAWLVLPLTLAVGVFLLVCFYEIPSVEDPDPLGIVIIVLLTGLLVAGSVAAAYCILAGAGVKRSPGQMYLMVTASMAANYSTPVKAGIPLRVYFYKRFLRIGVAKGSALVGLESLLGTLVPAVIALFALLFLLPEGGLAVPAVVAVGTSGTIASIAFVRSGLYDRVVSRLPLPTVVRKLLAPDGDIVAAVRGVPLWSLGAAAGIYAAMFVLLGVRAFYAFQLFGGSMNVLELVGISAAAYALGFVSLLPMGLGVRDATLVALFVQAGADRDVAIAVAALDRLLSTGVPLILGLLSAQILGLRAIVGPKEREVQTAVAESEEDDSTAPRAVAAGR